MIRSIVCSDERYIYAVVESQNVRLKKLGVILFIDMVKNKIALIKTRNLMGHWSWGHPEMIKIYKSGKYDKVGHRYRKEIKELRKIFNNKESQ